MIRVDNVTLKKMMEQVDLMAGCKVADGCSTMMVRLSGVAMFIGKIGLLVAVSVLVILLIRFFTGYTEDDEGKVEFITGKTSVKDAMVGVIKIFTVAVAIVYVVVPEGLPLVASILNEKNDIRLSACEMMGSATTICCDKTGTLTLNLGGRDVEVSRSPTEKAILQWGVKLGMNFDVVRSECSVIYASPFNSEKKRGSVAVKRIIVWKQSLYLLLSENSLCFMYVVIWIRKICFSSLTHVNKITIKCDLF
uniref:Cation-transporting P-type ATPase C-terminal domain-containing protein n=1 Tax=Lactuca sativa TaxID=4236 RepID=A0A9R1XEE0_LACSA|nr:hypothetical protein LSAT_V11C400219350 [Lactuca sativa]